MLGDTVTVNGVAWPNAEVVGALYRLRLLNASNARTYDLALEPPPPGGGGLVQIGSDAGLLTTPVRHDSIHISPGERYDVLVDFTAYPDGTEVTLRNTLEDGPTGYVMRFVVTGRASDDARIPDTLAPGLGPPPANRPADRSFSLFSGPAGTGLPPMINLKPFDAARIDADPRLGLTEIWDVTADPSHPFHTHLGHFRVLLRDGGPPLPQDGGLKDTVFISEGGVRLAVTFGGHRGKYVFHCHNLEHGDTGMMANLEVR
jgi:spore coat protein A